MKKANQFFKKYGATLNVTFSFLRNVIGVLIDLMKH